METYRTYIRLTLHHAYYPDYRCRALQVRPLPETRQWLARRGNLIVRERDGKWTLSGPEGAAFAPGEKLCLELCIGNPGWHFFTDWQEHPADEIFDIALQGGERRLRVPGRNRKTVPPRAPRIAGRIEIPLDQIPAGRKMWRITLAFRSRNYFWEYYFLPRNQTHPHRRIMLEEENKRLVFSPIEACRLQDRSAWRCRSTEPINTRLQYDYQLRLNEEMPFGQKTLMKRVAYPLPGQFAPAERDCIRQLIYF